MVPRPAVWRPGAPAPWPTPAPQCAVVEIVDRVVGSTRPAPDPMTPPVDRAVRDAAVLVLLAEGARGAEVVLTKRSHRLRHHAGEMSFPGGRLDAGEDHVAAALRETFEEVGIRADDIEVVGTLTPMATFVSSTRIVPVVGTTSQRRGLVPHGSEVERAMWTPLAELTAPHTYRQELWSMRGAEIAMHFFDLDDETVWGATARMLHELLVLVHDPPPATRTAV